MECRRNNTVEASSISNTDVFRYVQHRAFVLEQTASGFNERRSLAVQGRFRLTCLCAVFGKFKRNHRVILNQRYQVYILWTVHRDTHMWERPTLCTLFLNNVYELYYIIPYHIILYHIIRIILYYIILYYIILCKVNYCKLLLQKSWWWTINFLQ